MRYMGHTIKDKGSGSKAEAVGREEKSTEEFYDRIHVLYPLYREFLSLRAKEAQQNSLHVMEIVYRKIWVLGKFWYL